jgi:hypothetical protein
MRDEGGAPMKFCVTFKTPDAASFESFIEYAELEVIRRHGIEDDRVDPEREDLVDEYNDIAHEMVKFAKKWVRSEEYVTLEFDTDKGTCTVLRS